MSLPFLKNMVAALVTPLILICVTSTSPDEWPYCLYFLIETIFLINSQCTANQTDFPRQFILTWLIPFRKLFYCDWNVCSKICTDIENFSQQKLVERQAIKKCWMLMDGIKSKSTRFYSEHYTKYSTCKAYNSYVCLMHTCFHNVDDN